MTETDWLAILDADRRGLDLGAPASDASLSALAARLGRPVPADLRSLLTVADGFQDRAGQWQCAWIADRIAAETEQLWTAGSLDGSRLAFGDNGAGDPFCLVLTGEAEGQVEEWSAIDGEPIRSWPDLASFWSDWLAA